MTEDFKIVFHEADEGGYWVEIPAFPGCVSEGDTFEEAKANILEAAEGWLQTKMEWLLSKKAVRVADNKQEFAYA